MREGWGRRVEREGNGKELQSNRKDKDGYTRHPRHQLE